VKGKVNPSDAALRAWVYGSDNFERPGKQWYFQIDNGNQEVTILVIEGNRLTEMCQRWDRCGDVRPTDVGTIEMQNNL